MHNAYVCAWYQAINNKINYIQFSLTAPIPMKPYNYLYPGWFCSITTCIRVGSAADAGTGRRVPGCTDCC